jgi:4-hydroxy-2-oxoheptanedioate aldolase
MANTVLALEMLIIGLVEDAERLDNLDDMLKVEGVDAFWIGAGDLSQSMGYPGQADHPVIMEAMDEAVRKIVAAGKVAGWTGADHLIPRYMGLGALLFHGLVQGLVRTGAEEYLKQRHDEIAALAG